MTRPRLSRRTALRLGGLTLGLPLLEQMFDNRAFAQQAVPKRYVVIFCGMAVEGSGNINHFVPDAPGPLVAPLKLALKPFESLKNYVSIVSGLKLPQGQGGANVPPGGSAGSSNFHSETIGPLVSGMRYQNSEDAQGASSDYIVAQKIGAGARVPHLSLRVEAGSYQGYTQDISFSAPLVPVVATASPRSAFDKVFRDFTAGVPGGNPQEEARLAKVLRQRLKVLELSRTGGERLVSSDLGSYDRRRMEEHLAGIRSLEQQLQAFSMPPPAPVGSSCQKLQDPGQDPGIGSTYSGEEQRAKFMFDLIHMAFTCDITRSVAVMMSQGMSQMVLPTSVTGITSGNNRLHELGHSGTALNHALGLQWHARHVAYLLEKLRSTPEASGNMLDHTALVFLTEAGSGSRAPHTTDGMSVLVAGGGRLRGGQHIVAPLAHPSKVTAAAMNAVGAQVSGLGEIPGQIDQLLV